MKKYIILLLAFIFFSLSCSNSDKNNKPVYPTNCATSLAGVYTGSDICPSSGPSSYQCVITANTLTNITISNLYSVQITAEVNCTDNTITIPSQTFSGSLSISGTGTYTANRIIINWNGTSFGSPISCSTTYTR